MRRRTFLRLAGAAALVPRVALAQPQQVISVGFSYSSPTWSWYDVVSGINNGFMLDLMAAIAKDQGSGLAFHGAGLNDLASLLAAKNIDVISTVFTPDRDPQGVADYSNPVWIYGEALLIKKTDTTRYRSIQDLKGKTVSPGVWGVQLAASGVPMKLASPNTTVDTIDAMRSGAVDLAIYTVSTVAYIINSGDYPDMATAKDYVPSFTQPVRLAVRKGDTTLLSKINASLVKLMTDGTVKTIWAKYHLDWTPPK